MAALIAVLASSTADSNSTGALLIVATLVFIVVAIGAVWMFTAKRASRMSKRASHRQDHGVRGS